MEISESEAIINRYVEAFNRCDVDGMASELTDDVIVETVNENIYDDDELEGVDAFCLQSRRDLELIKHREQIVKSYHHFPEETHVDVLQIVVPYTGVVKSLPAESTITYEKYYIFTFAVDKIKRISSIYLD